MLTRKRIIIILILVNSFILATVLTDVGEISGEEVCLVCQSTRDMRKTHYFFFGASWIDEEYSKQIDSPFLVSFPEYQCTHDWQTRIGKEVDINYIWQSPIVRQGFHHQTSWTAPNAIIDGYSHSETFRQFVDTFLKDRRITREKLLALSKNACMDGGTCQMKHDDPLESMLLEAIYDFWNSPIYQDRLD